MTTALHVAVDMDDVLVEFSQGILDAVYRETGVLIPQSDLVSWDLGDHGVDRALGENWWDWLRRRDWLWATFDATPGAIAGIRKLRVQGHYVELVTKKPEWAEWCVWRWMGKWRPDAQRVTVVPSDERKCDHTDARILVDDNYENIDTWCSSRFDRAGLLYRRPWNAEVSVFNGPIFAVADWSRVLSYVEKLSTVGVVA